MLCSLPQAVLPALLLACSRDFSSCHPRGAAFGVASVGLSQHELGAFVTAGAFLSKGEA